MSDWWAMRSIIENHRTPLATMPSDPVSSNAPPPRSLGVFTYRRSTRENLQCAIRFLTTNHGSSSNGLALRRGAESV